jgi:hypothetical protein
MPRAREPEPSGGSGFRWSLAAIGLAGLAVRVGYVLVFRRDVDLGSGDAYFYSEGANLVAGGQGFVEPLAWSIGHVEQSASHPPLYLLW